MEYSGRLIGVTLSNGLVCMATSAHTDKDGVTLNGHTIADMQMMAPEPAAEGEEQKPPSMHINFSTMASRTIPWNRVVFVDTYNPSTLDGNLKQVYHKLSGIIIQ